MRRKSEGIAGTEQKATAPLTFQSVYRLKSEE
nr:MAG TPA: hypothetical protein [Caudoviricetes sp.]